MDSVVGIVLKDGDWGCGCPVWRGPAQLLKNRHEIQRMKIRVAVFIYPSFFEVLI
jgi:hypothetical protein